MIDDAGAWGGDGDGDKAHHYLHSKAEDLWLPHFFVEYCEAMYILSVCKKELRKYGTQIML